MFHAVSINSPAKAGMAILPMIEPATSMRIKMVIA